VICRWLAWLLRVKKPECDVNLEAVLVSQHESHETNDLAFNITDEASSTHVTHVKCNEVCATKQS